MHMARNKLGSHTFRPEVPVYIANWAAVAGKKEAEGPLGHGFDTKSMDPKFGERTWEQAEKKMQQLALYKLLDKARITAGDVDLVFSGDLLTSVSAPPSACETPASPIWGCTEPAPPWPKACCWLPWQWAAALRTGWWP